MPFVLRRILQKLRTKILLLRQIIKITISEHLLLSVGTSCLAVAWLFQNFEIDPKKDSVGEIEKTTQNFFNFQNHISIDQEQLMTLGIAKNKLSDSLYLEDFVAVLVNEASDYIGMKSDMIVLKYGEDSVPVSNDIYNSEMKYLSKLTKRNDTNSLKCLLAIKQDYTERHSTEAQDSALNRSHRLSKAVNRYQNAIIFLAIFGTLMVSMDKGQDSLRRRKQAQITP